MEKDAKSQERVDHVGDCDEEDVVEQCPMVLFVSVEFGGNKPVLPVEVRQEGADGYEQGKFRAITED